MTYEQFCYYAEEEEDLRAAIMPEEEEYDFCGYIYEGSEPCHI